MPSRPHLVCRPPPQSRGADPTITSDDFDPYLDPGPKTPAVMAPPDARVRAALAALESAYADVPKVCAGVG